MEICYTRVNRHDDRLIKLVKSNYDGHVRKPKAPSSSALQNMHDEEKKTKTTYYLTDRMAYKIMYCYIVFVIKLKISGANTKYIHIYLGFYGKL